MEEYSKGDAYLLGRLTYEMLWPGWADLTRSVDQLITSLRLDKRLEEKTPLADIICLTRST
jgi:hypothetical protein